MKRIKTFALILTVCISASACSGENQVNPNTNSYETGTVLKTNFTAEKKDYIYNVDNSYMFTVDDNGILYYIYQDLGQENLKTLLIEKDLNGDIINETELSSEHLVSAITVHDNLLYCAVASYGKIQSVIYSHDLDSGKREEICVIDGFTNIKNLYVIGNTVYAFGSDEALKSKYYTQYNAGDFFTYNGETVKYFNLTEKNLKDIPVELPVAVTKTADNNLFIYAYDENGGYYFQKYDTSLNDIITENKIYNNSLKMFDSFVVTDVENEVVFNFQTSLKISGITQENASTELSNDCFGLMNNNLILRSGYLFYRTETGVRRILLSEFFRSLLELNMIYTDRLFDFPLNYGYNVVRKEIDYYEFALEVLAGSNDTDIYLLDSRQRMTDSIRSKGAFYPLNEVEGVNEYIDACFPYVKEAATDENGDIWMFPINLKPFFYEYDSKKFEEYGIDIQSVKTFPDLAEMLENIMNINPDENYNINYYTIAESYFYQLLNQYRGFDKNAYKKMVEFFYNELNYIKNDIWNVTNWTSKTDLVSSGSQLFASAYGFTNTKISNTEGESFDDPYEYFSSNPGINIDFNFWVNYSYLSAMPFPKIDGAVENDITCDFICINPNSKNLSATLDYVAVLCKNLSKKENSFIFIDKSTYFDKNFINNLYEIHKNGFIRFGVDNELFFDNFYLYLEDKLTLEELLDQTEFKINAYMNE